MNTVDKIVEILKNNTEDSEIVQGDIVSYVPDWSFKEVAEQIVKNCSIPDFVGRSEQYFCQECTKQIYAAKTDVCLACLEKGCGL